jgi:hypothetical protein
MNNSVMIVLELDIYCIAKFIDFVAIQLQLAIFLYLQQFY